jgi:hydrogenase expression/formation protein HypC
MCLGIPGQIVEIADAEKQFGRVEISGTTRPVYLGLLAPEAVQIGTWVLINASMAIRRLEADEASQLLQFVQALDRQCEEEHL